MSQNSVKNALRNGRSFYPKKLYFKEKLSMTLKNQVSGRFDRVNNEGCVSEMTAMLNCIKEHEFENSPCSVEIQAFENCVATHKKEMSILKDSVKKGLFANEDSQMTFSQVNQLLKKYPQPGVKNQQPCPRLPNISYADPNHP